MSFTTPSVTGDIRLSLFIMRITVVLHITLILSDVELISHKGSLEGIWRWCLIDSSLSILK